MQPDEHPARTEEEEEETVHHREHHRPRRRADLEQLGRGREEVVFRSSSCTEAPLRGLLVRSGRQQSPLRDGHLNRRRSSMNACLVDDSNRGGERTRSPSRQLVAGR